MNRLTNQFASVEAASRYIQEGVAIWDDYKALPGPAEQQNWVALVSEIRRYRCLCRSVSRRVLNAIARFNKPEPPTNGHNPDVEPATLAGSTKETEDGLPVLTGAPQPLEVVLRPSQIPDPTAQVKADLAAQWREIWLRTRDDLKDQADCFVDLGLPWSLLILGSVPEMCDALSSGRRLGFLLNTAQLLLPAVASLQDPVTFVFIIQPLLKHVLRSELVWAAAHELFCQFKPGGGEPGVATGAASASRSGLLEIASGQGGSGDPLDSWGFGRILIEALSEFPPSSLLLNPVKDPVGALAALRGGKPATATLVGEVDKWVQMFR